jgi:uncharacterized membrane protein
MSTLIRQSPARMAQARPIAWGTAGLFSIVALTALGLQYGFEGWSRAFMHGLCAQRESHSFHFGGDVLPVDARMTGIYLGAASTIGWLATSGRLRGTRRPGNAMIVLLALFVLAMAVDGFNALLGDLALPSPYEPSNLLRFVTGTLAGSALGVGAAYLFATSIWRHPDRTKRMIDGPTTLALPLLLTGAMGIMAASGLQIFYGPLVITLVFAAIAVFWTFGVTLLALLSGRGWSYTRASDLGALGVYGLLAGVALIAAFAGFRYLAERAWGLPQLS